MTEDVLKSCARLRDWYVNDALPLWLDRGYDHARGGFYETLDFHGRPITGQPRRVRVQARQIYTFTEAALTGWLPEGEAIAAKAFDFYIDKACPDEGARGCVHLLSDSGEILDNRRDLYDQAFLLLVCAARIKAGDDRARTLADRVIDFLNSELASPHGGWRESDADNLPRRQNPHMHLFEAFMALYTATDEDRYFDYAARIINECFRRFMDRGEGVLREYFTETLAFDQNRPEIEPGHMFEWVWLLKRYEVIADVDFSDERNLLYVRGSHFGEDPKFFGFVSNSINIEFPNKRSAKRLWPQTEYLKASCVQAQKGDKHAADLIAVLTSAMFDTYLNVEQSGLWIDEYDEHGAPTAKDVPASILYHLFEAANEAAQYAERVKSS